MSSWSRFERACLARHGVADVALARAHGISANTFYRRTAHAAWGQPLPGLRVHPEAGPSVQQRLVVVCSSTGAVAAASGSVAAWLHGLRQRPPRGVTVLVRHPTTCPPYGGVVVRRARWLDAADVVEVQGVPTLRVPALLLTLLDAPSRELFALLVDTVQRRLTTPADVLDRLVRVGPVAGKQVLREQVQYVAAHRTESVFQAAVVAELERLGYRPERSTRRIGTADGYGLTADVPLPAWQVAVEPEGDAFHRTREQRRVDRRREAAFAGTDWARVPVDWRDWFLDRHHVLDAIDAAIAAQRRRGIGSDIPPPPRTG